MNGVEPEPVEPKSLNGAPAVARKPDLLLRSQVDVWNQPWRCPQASQRPASWLCQAEPGLDRAPVEIPGGRPAREAGDLRGAVYGLVVGVGVSLARQVVRFY
jgi:hypothetical protein